MPTLELEKLGLVDLSNEKDALTQVVGGRRGQAATLVPYNNPFGGVAVPGFVQEVRTSTPGNPSPVTVFSGSISNPKQFRLGTMTVQSNGKYFAPNPPGLTGRRLRAQSLFFDGFDQVEYEGLRGSIG
ncbi:MAG: hypothetical protein AAF378_18650 [Cyanobacteria bacterium P01_A01_bin.84]